MSASGILHALTDHDVNTLAANKNELEQSELGEIWSEA